MILKRAILIGLVILCANPSFAQQAAQNMHFAVDQPAPDLASAQGYTYKHYDDNSATGVAYTSVTCSGTTSPFTCVLTIGAYTPGNHTIQLTASNVAGESAKSAPFTFAFVVTPGSPSNIRIVP